jgi:hypothetical protein
MSHSYVYDKSKYHMGEGSQFASTWEQASATALFILRWMMDRNFLSDFAMEDVPSSLDEYRAGRMSLFKLYEREFDLCLIDDMLSDEGNAFGRLYFDYNEGLYLSDLQDTLHYKVYPDFTEEAYQLVRPIFNSRYEAWKKGDLGSVKKAKKKKGWMFWKGGA